MDRAGKHRVSAGRDVLSPQRQADAFKKVKRNIQEAQAQKATLSSVSRDRETAREIETGTERQRER